MKCIRRSSLLLIAGGLAVLGCKDRPASSSAEGSGSSAEKVETLTVYSGRTEALIAPIIDGFETDTGVRVRVKYADTAQLAATLLSEKDKSPADVFIAQDASSLAFLEDKGVFAELPAALLDRVPERFRSAKGHWIGVSGRARVLSYHPEKVAEDELPESVAELTEPRWRGRVGWAPENASFQSFVAAMLQLEGAEATEKWLKAMKANEPRDYPKNTPAVLAISRGEVDVALVNHYYLHRLRDEHGDEFPVKNHYFPSGDAGAMINLSGAAVLGSSKKQELAHQLLGYLVADEAQARFARENHEFPLAAGVDRPADLPAVDDLRTPEVDLAQLENLEETVRLLRSTGVLR